MSASDQPVVMPLELQPGHWKTIIEEMEGHLVDQRLDIVVYVDRKDFDAAYKTAIEIRELEFWIEHFTYDMSGENADE